MTKTRIKMKLATVALAALTGALLVVAGCASDGKDGKDGAPGRTGDPGRTGEDGGNKTVIYDHR